MQTLHATPVSAPVHEFSSEHDATLARAGSWARQLGIVCFIAAAFALASGSFIAAGVQILAGALLVRASKDLRAIVQTTGQDVAHLVTAADRLARMLRIRIVIMCIGLPIAMVGFFAQVLRS